MPESLLITGPAASGKSSEALRHFLSEPDALLLTPTATMAEHIRNQLARQSIPVRPSRVMTLAHYLDRAKIPAGVSRAILHMLTEQALERLQPERFIDVAEYKGFRHAVSSLIEAAERSSLPPELAVIAKDVERNLAARGLALRNARLRAAALDQSAPPKLIVIDGFFTFSDAELTLIESLARRTRVVVTMPDWLGSASARSRLTAAGVREIQLNTVHRAPDKELFCSAAQQQETEEIARRILDEAAHGRPFREMGIVLRVREPYAGALATTLERFGIPARFYFAEPLASHAAIAFVSGVMRAALSGWDHADLLRLIRMPVSGLGGTAEGDRFDFDTRAKLPSRGLPMNGLPEPLASSLLTIAQWTHERTDARGWSTRLKTLRALIPRPAVNDGPLDADQLQAWTSTARALDAFDALVDEIAGALSGASRIPALEFWKHIESALELTEWRMPDRRRDVVHVLDVFEARQWQLPIVFVCGMVERHFPQYHREDPLLDDAARRRAGLPSSVDLQREERSLFELAVTRATERTILSYSRFDEKGDPTLPSFFLGASSDSATQCETRVRPRPRRAVPLPLAASLGADLHKQLREMHRALSPSSIERFLQCPFQFFGDRTLRLKLRPPAPRDRLDVLAQGSIVHAAIAALEERPLWGVEIFDSVFADEIAKRRVPGGYRTEAVRLEMLRNFTQLVGDGRVALGWASRVEEKFDFAVTPALRVRGRIDRLEIGPNREALVIDYKYSAAAKIKERVRDQDKGEVVQAGLYLLAAVKQFGMQPAGMLYCGLRKDVEWGGWHLPLPGLEQIGESCSASRLEELTEAAQAKAIEVFEAITTGAIEVRPTNEKKCDWCDYRDVCRVETK